MKRFLSAFLAVFIILSVVPVFAETGTNESIY